MDKETLSSYGWIVCVLLVVSIMIGLASPFAEVLRDKFAGTTNTLTDQMHGALDSVGGEDSGDAELPAGGEVAENGEILDSWEVIINNVNNGTYATKYAVGDYKPLDLGSEGVVNMQIAAINADVLSDDSGNAHITWIAKELLATKHIMNNNGREGYWEEPTNENGWAASKMRTYLNNDIWALIDPTVQNAIVTVDKTYYDYTTQSTLVSEDKLWIPSWREVGFADGKENSGVIYSELFIDTASRIKNYNGSAASWWLRSAVTYSGDDFYCVSDGRNAAGNAHSSHGVALSFCF